MPGLRRAALLLAVFATDFALGGGPRLARAESPQACDSNLLIVLDRSCSMSDPPNANETASKWDLAGQAISELTASYAGRLRFGLAMFPDRIDPKCGQDGIDVPVGPDQEAAVLDAFMATQPDGPCVTNLDSAMASVRRDPAYAFPFYGEGGGRRSFLLLLSDGQQSDTCGGAEKDPVTERTIADLFDDGFPTYVVGFGGAVDAEGLKRFARAGGVPSADGPAYYAADGGDGLRAAIADIAGAVVGEPEFDGCAGTPCPDGRCYGDGEECKAGVCERAEDPSGEDDMTAGDGVEDPASSPDAGEPIGCGCRAGSSGGAFPRPGVALGFLLVLLLLVRLRRGPER